MPTDTTPRAFSSNDGENGSDSQTESVSSTVQYQPETIRVPKRGERFLVTALSKSHIRRLIGGDNPKVRSICIKEPHAQRGVRLVVVSSLLDYIYSQEGES